VLRPCSFERAIASLSFPRRARQVPTAKSSCFNWLSTPRVPFWTRRAAEASYSCFFGAEVCNRNVTHTCSVDAIVTTFMATRAWLGQTSCAMHCFSAQQHLSSSWHCLRIVGCSIHNTWQSLPEHKIVYMPAVGLERHVHMYGGELQPCDLSDASFVCGHFQSHNLLRAGKGCSKGQTVGKADKESAAGSSGIHAPH
jgi:hypothetical protein